MRTLMAVAIVLTTGAGAAAAPPIASETLAPPPGITAAKPRPAGPALPLPPRPVPPPATPAASPSAPPAEVSAPTGLAPSLLGRSQPGQSSSASRP